MHKQTNGQTEKWTNRQTDKWTNREMDEQTNRQTDKQTNRQMKKQEIKQTKILTDTDTVNISINTLNIDKHKGKQTEIQTMI